MPGTLLLYKRGVRRSLRASKQCSPQKGWTPMMLPPAYVRDYLAGSIFQRPASEYVLFNHTSSEVKSSLLKVAKYS